MGPSPLLPAKGSEEPSLQFLPSSNEVLPSPNQGDVRVTDTFTALVVQRPSGKTGPHHHTAIARPFSAPVVSRKARWRAITRHFYLFLPER